MCCSVLQCVAVCCSVLQSVYFEDRFLHLSWVMALSLKSCHTHTNESSCEWSMCMSCHTHTNESSYKWRLLIRMWMKTSHSYVYDMTYTYEWVCIRMIHMRDSYEWVIWMSHVHLSPHVTDIRMSHTQSPLSLDSWHTHRVIWVIYMNESYEWVMALSLESCHTHTNEPHSVSSLSRFMARTWMSHMSNSYEWVIWAIHMNESYE